MGLEQTGIKEWVTGKFVMQVRDDSDRNSRLFVAIELAPNETASDDRRLAAANSVLAQLLRLNSEFAHYVPAPVQFPQVELHPTGAPDYFPVGVKHRYTRQ